MPCKGPDKWDGLDDEQAHVCLCVCVEAYPHLCVHTFTYIYIDAHTHTNSMRTGRQYVMGRLLACSICSMWSLVDYTLVHVSHTCFCIHRVTHIHTCKSFLHKYVYTYMYICTHKCVCVYIYICRIMSLCVWLRLCLLCFALPERACM